MTPETMRDALDRALTRLGHRHDVRGLDQGDALLRPEGDAAALDILATDEHMRRAHLAEEEAHCRAEALEPGARVVLQGLHGPIVLVVVGPSPAFPRDSVVVELAGCSGLRGCSLSRWLRQRAREPHRRWRVEDIGPGELVLREVFGGGA